MSMSGARECASQTSSQVRSLSPKFSNPVTRGEDGGSEPMDHSGGIARAGLKLLLLDTQLGSPL